MNHRPAARVPRLVRKLLLGMETSGLLTLASAAVALLPGHWLTKLLGDVSRPSATESRPGASVAPRRVGRAVELVAARLPWRPACLAQAITTRVMLRRRGIPCEAHLGIVETAPFAAHAWITVNGVVVQGGTVSGITELATFR